MQREPVRRAVMLLGWSGSKLRHVRKHEACWPSGTAVFAENVTIEDTFSRGGRQALREKARRLVAEAKATKAPRLYAHIFSNGGCMLLLEVLSELEPLRLDGVVYDSAPSQEGTIRPIAGPVIAWLSASRLRERLAAVWSTLWPALLAFPVRKAHLSHFDDLYDASVNVPRRELFMYSDADRLVWRSHVEQFVKLRRDQGSIVAPQTCNFGETPHVGHFRAHPKVYRAAVSGWVDDIELKLYPDRDQAGNP